MLYNTGKDLHLYLAQVLNHWSELTVILDIAKILPHQCLGTFSRSLEPGRASIAVLNRFARDGVNQIVIDISQVDDTAA